eukprot:TRINITY_DN1240_c0_g1_i3.p1 TRINITY_DN1240_c0_g1~~TRINITY_DN1240_c0_g1_i3.p1  ORF type:complete len:110 (+),score=30.49 TRINITY_DN1240_c0_g1_i3:2-331(+)
MFFFLMIRRPPRSTQSRSSAASDVYKRQDLSGMHPWIASESLRFGEGTNEIQIPLNTTANQIFTSNRGDEVQYNPHVPVSYTHLRAHETDSYLVCRLLLEKKKKTDWLY